MATTTKKTKKNSPKAAAGKVSDLPDMQGEAGFESQAPKDSPVTPSRQGSEQADPLLARLDRIIELLEGTVKVERKGIDFDTPAWARFLKE